MIRAIDHVVMAVADLDEAAGLFETAGFTVTPRADHPFGTSNRLIVTDGSYVELVGVTKPELIPSTGFAAKINDKLGRNDPGIAFLALRSTDARADHAALAESGQAEGDVLRFGRPAPLVGGGTIRAEFSLAFTKAWRVFYCQHHTPEAIWNPQAMTHTNGSRRMTAVGFDAGQALEGIEILDRPGLTFDDGTRQFELAGLIVRY